MNDTNQRGEDVAAKDCAICGASLGEVDESEWYFGHICPEASIEAWAHRRCV